MSWQQARGQTEEWAPPKPGRRESLVGLGLAAGIVTLWGANLVWWLGRDLGAWPWWAMAGGALAQVWLYTGVFIVSHDAIHGLVTPSWPRLNHGIGRVCALLYALFSYDRLRGKHHEHHRHPARVEQDPDYHDGRRRGLVGWYFTFMFRYLSLWQVLGMALVFNVLLHGLGVPEANLLLFWVAPALLSTVQLFVFGTWLPHRRRGGEADGWPDDVHRAHSNGWPAWLSLLTCFHFGGCHWEHHAWPWVPWWRLPAARRGQA